MKDTHTIERGGFYVEIMIALLMVGIVSTYFVPLLPKLLKKTQQVSQYGKLTAIAEYTGSYLFRWIQFSRTSRNIPFSYYSDGSELEITEEHRINRLLWAVPPELKNDYLSDHYKVSMTFKDTAGRTQSAGIHVQVWYDSNLNNQLDNNEDAVTFDTIISEKEAP